MSEWIKNKTQQYAAYKRLASALRIHISLKWRDGRRYFMQVKTKRAEVATLMLDKTHFNSKAVIRDKERHYTMIKGSIHQEDITIINILYNI